ncbi:MAG: hypothetical protein JST00_39710 [Deltaproteobacteria bacterium]|nr:hypothetical protein [Deltaproteobacteria bacterium]
MIREAKALAVLVALGLGAARDPGCGGGDSPNGGENAPCTRNKDCRGGLQCSEGVCTEPDSGAPRSDGGSPDTGAPDASSDGG